MKGRCLLSASRAPGYDFDERTKDGSLRDAAQAAFDAYLKKYPEGRFASDAKGWLGGLAWDAEDYLGSLEWYIRQAETPDHPEVLKSVVLMIEKTLRRLAATEDAEKRKAAFALVAAHPQVAMGMLYLVLGSPDAAFRFQYPEDRETPSMLTDKIRKWRQTLLPELAAAVAAQQPAYQSEAWHPRYLALLVHAASNAGKHDEALRIAALDPQPEASEDLSFAKAVALQRAGKTAEAIAQYRLLLKKFPGHYPPGVPAAIRERGGHYYNPHQENPLGDAARIRLAIALRDNHQTGLALLELKALQVEQGEKTYEEPFRFLADYTFAFTDSGIYPSLSNAEPEQIAQLTDTLRHFAPLPELAAAAEKTDDQAFAWDLRALIAKRALAREDFLTARQMMSAAQYGPAHPQRAHRAQRDGAGGGSAPMLLPGLPEELRGLPPFARAYVRYSLSLARLVCGLRNATRASRSRRSNASPLMKSTSAQKQSFTPWPSTWRAATLSMSPKVAEPRLCGSSGGGCAKAKRASKRPPATWPRPTGAPS